LEDKKVEYIKEKTKENLGGKRGQTGKIYAMTDQILIKRVRIT
jgi:hypothetical protein